MKKLCSVRGKKVCDTFFTVIKKVVKNQARKGKLTFVVYINDASAEIMTEP